MYAGKKNDCDDGALLGEWVVLELTKSFRNKGHHVYCGNFYTSPSLCLKLEEKSTGCCGTVQINCKGIPISFQQKSSKKERKSHTKMVNDRCEVDGQVSSYSYKYHQEFIE